MISELMNYYIMEKLDKQIINKIPYCMFLSIIFYFVFPPIGIYLLVLFVFFIISTYLFNHYINRKIENVLMDIDFKEYANKISSIFQGKSSIIDDIDVSNNSVMFLLGILSGLSLTLLLSFSFLEILYSINIAKEILIVGIIFVSLYLLQDIAKFSVYEDFKESERKSPLMVDIMERYAINNSLKKLYGNTILMKIILQILIRISGLVVHLSIPNYSFDRTLIYKNPDLVKLIKKLMCENTSKKDGNDICIKYIDGYPPEKFFIEDKGEQISMIKEKTPKEAYPYLFDPDYSYDENEQRKRKWIIFNIVKDDSNNSKIVGYIYLHLFRGVKIKKKINRQRKSSQNISPFNTINTDEQIFLFTFFGERSVIGYLKNEIEFISVRMPSELINITNDGENLDKYSS